MNLEINYDRMHFAKNDVDQNLILFVFTIQTFVLTCLSYSYYINHVVNRANGCQIFKITKEKIHTPCKEKVYKHVYVPSG